MLLSGWTTPLALTKDEVVQRRYEGCVVPDHIVDALDRMDPGDEDALAAVQAELEILKSIADFPYEQPNDLDAIRALRPDGPRTLDIAYADDVLLDRMHGAWTGKCVGCALGKPVEIMGMQGFKELNGRRAIKRYLEARNDWPLTDYVSGVAANDGGMGLLFPASQRENVAFMEPDDDIHYALIGLKVLEQYGADFTWTNVADTWNSSLSYQSICTAETQAILNYNAVTPHFYTRQPGTYASPEFTRRHNNPYREWIGAQIRADGWAYCCAGQPERAAEFAWRDAHWTHTANGIYGEMMAAAMIAAAFVEDDPFTLVEIGLSEIPANCRLAQAVRIALEWCDTCADFEAFLDRLETHFGDMSPVHTVNNTLVIVMSLIYGDMDPDRSMCLAVMAGLDTDSHTATVGSIVGAARGKSRFGGNLHARLNDTVKPLVFGFQDVSMRSLAERCLAVRANLLDGDA